MQTQTMTPQDEDHVWNLMSRVFGDVTFLDYPSDNVRGMRFDLNCNMCEGEVEYAEDVLKGHGVTLSWETATTFTATLR